MRKLFISIGLILIYVIASLIIGFLVDLFLGDPRFALLLSVLSLLIGLFGLVVILAKRYHWKTSLSALAVVLAILAILVIPGILVKPISNSSLTRIRFSSYQESTAIMRATVTAQAALVKTRVASVYASIRIDATLTAQAAGQTEQAPTTPTRESQLTATPVYLVSVDKLVSAAIDQLAQGQIVFNPPDEMNVADPYEITARITKNLSEEARKTVVDGLGEAGVVPQVEEINVSSEMKVELTAMEGDAFEITALSEAQQPIGQTEYTEWKWRVTPLKSGQKTLVLKATAIIEIPGLLPKTKSLPVLEHEIEVRVNAGYSIRSFVAKYWLWFVAAAIGLLVTWFWMRRKGGQSRGAGGQPTSPQAIDLVQPEKRKAITILFLAANPSDTARLRIDKESSAIDYALQQSKHRDVFEIEQHWAVRVTDLSGLLLRYQPDIVHFSGHGSTSSEIILEDEFGNGQPVSERALSELFAILTDNIRCVVLNACFSKPQAEAIAKHIDCVIGMSEAIGDDAAISFAAAFYQALGFGRDLKTAFDLGCVQIDLKGLDEQEIPQLIAVRSDPRKTFLIKE